MASLIISPHLDDAILSLGGYLLSRKDKNDLVFSLFNTAWTALDEDYSVQEITDMNLEEEKKVISMIGCKHKFGGYNEALLRGYTNWNAPLCIESEKELLEKIIFEICEVVKKGNFDKIFSPLAIGKHVDHVLVYEVAKKIKRKLEEWKIELLFYEDLPYATYGGRNERLQEIKNDFALLEKKFNISSFFEQKCCCLKCYKSQLNDLDIARIKKYAIPNSFLTEISENVWVLVNERN